MTFLTECFPAQNHCDGIACLMLARTAHDSMTDDLSQARLLHEFVGLSRLRGGGGFSKVRVLQPSPPISRLC